MASVIDDCKQEMEQTVGAFKRELARLRTSRATTALLDGIVVDYYGAKTHLNQLASLSAPEPRLLVVQPFDRSAIGDIERENGVQRGPRVQSQTRACGVGRSLRAGSRSRIAPIRGDANTIEHATGLDGRLLGTG